MIKNIWKTKMIGTFICMMFVSATFISGTASTTNLTNKNLNIGISKYILIRINTSQSLNTLPSEIEIVGERPGEWIDIIISDDRLDELSDFNYEVIIKDVIEHDNKVRGEYHTLAEIESILHTIADDYPDITSLYSIGTTYENRSIWCLEITDNPGVDEGEPGIVFTSLHHAREWPSVEICLYIADQLTSQYGSNQTITDIVNNRRLWLISCVNPDGYFYCHDQGHDWRKNRQPYGPYIGVDPNRNYDGSCDGNIMGAWGSIGDAIVSHNPLLDVYCGPGPCSEKETQAVAEVFLDNDICASLNWHTYGQQVLWPWGYTIDIAPDNSYLESIGEQIAQRITRQSGFGTYTPEQAGYLYKNTGGLNDWSYGYGHYIQGRPTFSYTIEACSSFHPAGSYLDQVCAENFDGALYLLQEAENIRNVAPRVLPPVIDGMTYDDDGNYIVSWEEQKSEEDADYFQLDELTNLSYITDDAEKGRRDLVWKYQTVGGITSSPTVVDGRIYIGSWDYRIYCLNAENGSHIWNYTTGDQIESSPEFYNSRIYIGSNDKNIYCLNADDGNVIWIYPTDGSVVSSPAVANGRVYIGSADDKIYCLNADNGSFIWSFTTDSYVVSSPAVVDGRVYIGSWDKKIYCLYADNGSFIWSYPTGGSIYSTPAVSDGKVYVGSYDNKIHCLNAENGNLIWDYKTGNVVESSPAVSDCRIYFGSIDDKIYCLNAENGDHIWNYTTGYGVDSSPVVVDDKICVGSGDWNIYCLSKNGDLIWNYDTGYPVSSSPYFYNDKIYVGSGNGNVYSLFAKSRLWFFNGFDISDSKSHSGDYCFYSGNSPMDISSLKTFNPIPITTGMDLSFWCYYVIDSYDRAFVEVSRDGRLYHIIDSYSGSSDGWIYKTYNFNEYEDESIYIRFRYTTHDFNPGEGFFIDDILPIADFGTVTTLSDSITDNKYFINGRSPGVYFYRVRGFNNNRKWGDFSTLEDINVMDQPPNNPTIDGPTKGIPGTKYEYTFSAEDSENHKISYFIKWGDDTTDGWTDYVVSGSELTLDHTWTEKKIYTISAKAKDIYGAESNWTTLEVNIPVNNMNSQLKIILKNILIFKTLIKLLYFRENVQSYLYYIISNY